MKSDIQYQKKIYDTLIANEKGFANMFKYTDTNPDVLIGGTRMRKTPLPGIEMDTYSPSTYAVGHLEGQPAVDRYQSHRKKPVENDEPPIKVKVSPKTDNDTVITGGGLKKANPWIEHVKAYAKEHNISYRDAIKESKSSYKPMTGGKVNRLKKAKKWTGFAVDTLGSAVDLADKGVGVAIKAKTLGAGMSGGSNPWIEHVRAYAKENNISYGCAISEAKKTYVKVVREKKPRAPKKEKVVKEKAPRKPRVKKEKVVKEPAEKDQVIKISVKKLSSASDKVAVAKVKKEKKEPKLKMKSDGPLKDVAFSQLQERLTKIKKLDDDMEGNFADEIHEIEKEMHLRLRQATERERKKIKK